MLENINIAITFIVLIGVFVCFLSEKYPPHIVAITGMAALLGVGAISSEDMLSVFSNSAPITIACMFVISAALDRTGVVDAMGRFLLKLLTGRGEISSIILLLFAVIAIGGFMNNTPLVIILTPVVITIAQKLGRYPSKYLIPLSYGAILGGTCTLIGTSTNILVDGVAQKYGQPAFSMFEITIPGLCFAAAGMVYMAFASKYLLPNRLPPMDEIDDPNQRKRFVAEAFIPTNSPLIGKTLNDIKFSDMGNYEIIDLVRKDHGNRLGLSEAISALLTTIRSAAPSAAQDTADDKPKKISPLRDIPLEAGDRLVFKVDKEELIELNDHISVQFDPDQEHISQAMAARSVIVAEGFIPHGSDMIGKRIRDLRLRRNYNCFVIGLHRNDENNTGEIGNTILRENDTLILEGPEEELEELFKGEQILSSSQMRIRELDTKRAPIAIITLFAVVFLAAIKVMPISGLSFIGAMVVILSGCVSPEKAYKTIDWRILMLIFGMLGIGLAMEKTGAMTMIVNSTVTLAHPLGPYAVLAIIYILTSTLTEFITNSAVAIVMTPIVIGVATSLGLDPRPFIVAVMFAASASFATPIGYQTNTFVYAAGGYKFKDFIIIGMPMNILMLIVAMIVIPLYWGF